MFLSFLVALQLSLLALLLPAPCWATTNAVADSTSIAVPRTSRLHVVDIIGTSPGPVQSSELLSPISAFIDGHTMQIGREVNTDKVTSHNYWYVYGRYLGHVRRQPLKLLEIGLGCDMNYGPGHSFHLWRKLLPAATISMIEVNVACANQWRDGIESAGRGRVYVGSQSDNVVLSAVLTDALQTGLYDIIIDDGSHKADDILKSHSVLWDAVKPGGIYVIEDLHTSNAYTWSRSREASSVPMLQHQLDKILCRSLDWHEQAKQFCSSQVLDVVSMDCAPEVCVLVKGLPFNFTQHHGG